VKVLINKKVPVSVIILTFNEGANIESCLESVFGWVNEIIIVDSYSTDDTLKICKKYTQRIYQHPFETQARQFNWALDSLEISSEWILRLDADESVTDELAKEIINILSAVPSTVSAFVIKRRNYFLGKWIRFGGCYPMWHLRLFRKGLGRCKESIMDEHLVVLSGRIQRLKNDIIHEDKRGITNWIDKHNKYAGREARGSFCEPLLANKMKADVWKTRKMWLKEKVYTKLPLFTRAFIYFIYRYFLRLGFLDGVEGFVYHFLQGLWYRFLVDVKIYEQIKHR
jgi:glycosyltransferase involved in cell wall biosynthesis